MNLRRINPRSRFRGASESKFYRASILAFDINDLFREIKSIVYLKICFVENIIFIQTKFSVLFHIRVYIYIEKMKFNIRSYRFSAMHLRNIWNGLESWKGFLYIQ